MSFDPRERSSIEYRAQVFAIRRGVSSLVTDCGCKLSVSGYTIPLSDLKDRLGKVAHHPGALRRIAGTSRPRERDSHEIQARPVSKESLRFWGILCLATESVNLVYQSRH